MTTASMTVAVAVHHPDRDPNGCAFERYASPQSKTLIPCNRKPVWKIDGLGYSCHWHFEKFMSQCGQLACWTIVRLSDNDADFCTKTEPGRGYGGAAYHKKHRHETSGSNGQAKRRKAAV